MRLTHALAAVLLALPVAASAQEHHQGPPGDHQGPPTGDHRGPTPAENDGQRRDRPDLGAMLEHLETLLGVAGNDPEALEKIHRLEEMAKDSKDKKPEEFQRIDTDGDGHISAAEAKAAAEKMIDLLKQKAPELFAKIDGNSDGKLSREEIHAARERFRQEHPRDRDPGDHPPGHETGGKSKEPGVDPEQERRRRGEGQ